MKKITLLIVLMLSSILGFSQTTVTVGTGTTASGSFDNGNPIYRSSAGSTFNFSQSVQLLKSTDLSAVGLTPGATITKIAYYKTSAFTLAAGRTANLSIYLKNSGNTTLVTTQDMATWTTGSTLGYSNAAISSAEIPAAAGWVEFTLTTPFNYTGGAIEVAFDWKGDTTASNLSTGAFLWQYTAGTAGQAVGTSNNVAITGNLATTQARLYNAQLTFTNNACTGTPAPGNTLASNVAPCPGANVTFSLQNATIGSGVTYQWYNNAGMIAGATNPSYTGAIIASDSYYCNVTCSGTTTASTAISVAPLAAVSSFPWIENFDGLVGTLGTTNFPSCWTKENGDWASANETTYNTANSGANYIRDSWTATNEYIWTQAFQLTAGTSYDFSTFIQGDGFTGWVVDYFYNTTANSAGATQLGASYNVPGNGTIALQPYNKVTQSFTPPTTGVYFFGVRVNQPSSTPWYVALDDFEVKLTPAVAPSCATNIVATPNASCGNEATAISWTAALNANGYNITMGTTMGGTDVLNNVDIGGATSYNFLGNLATTYYYTITPYNGTGSATGCTEQSFMTVATGCYCASVPTSNDGSGITNVQLGSTDFPNGNVTYFDHTATPVTFAHSINSNVQISFATGYTYDTNIWIDFNDNFVFEASELVKTGIASLATNPTVLDASFIMPASAPLGNHRMRIGTADDGQVPPDPCYSGAWGVTLDFTVNIIAPSCLPPAATAMVVPNCATNEFNVDVSVTALGTGTPSITDGTTTWPITAIGTVTVGPFASGSTNTLTVSHGSDVICDLPLGSFTYTCPPSNDDCTAPTVLTVGAAFADNSVVGTNVGATNSNQTAPGCADFQGGDVWYSVVVPASGNITIEINNDSAAGGTITDTGMAVYSGACGSLVLVECDDDDSTDGFFSMVSLTGQTPGSVLFVSVWEYANDTFSTFQVSAYDCPSATPAPMGAATQTFCAGSTVTNLVTTSGTNIKWYDAATAGNLLLSTDLLVDGTTYYATQGSNCESFARLAVTATVHPAIATPTGNATQTFCQSANITQLVVSGTNLEWYDAATGGNLLLNNSSVNLTDGTTYYATSTDMGCESTTRLAVTVVLSNPAAPTGDATQTFCGSANITQLVVIGSNITWYDAATGGNMLPNIAAIGLVNGSTYYASQTISGCEGSTRIPVLVNITQQQAATFTSIAPICAGSTAPILPATSNNGIMGTWSPSVVDNMANGSYVFTPDAGQCGTGTTLSVTVTPQASTPTGASMQTITGAAADNTIADLVVSPSNSVWYLTLADAQSGNNPLPLTTVLADGTTYYAVNETGPCRSEAFPVAVTVVVLSTDGFNITEFAAYPNPVREVLNLSYSSEITSVQVINLLGQEVISRKVGSSSTQIDMANLTAGAYIVNVTIGDFTKTIKVIKK